MFIHMHTKAYIHTYVPEKHTYVPELPRCAWEASQGSPHAVRTYMQMYTRTHICIYIYICMYTHTKCIYIYIYIYTHTHTHICTHSLTRLPGLPRWASLPRRLQRQWEYPLVFLWSSMCPLLPYLSSVYVYVYVYVWICAPSCRSYFLCMYVCACRYVHVFVCQGTMQSEFVCMYIFLCVCIYVYM